MDYKAPIKSGNEFIDGVFDTCVQILLWGADLLGISYNEINIWVFCVIWPILTILLFGLVIYQYLRIKKLKNDTSRDKLLRKIPKV